MVMKNNVSVEDLNKNFEIVESILTSSWSYALVPLLYQILYFKDKLEEIANDDSVPLQVQFASLVKTKISRTFIDELSMYNYRVFIKECLEILYKKIVQGQCDMLDVINVKNKAIIFFMPLEVVENRIIFGIYILDREKYLKLYQDRKRNDVKC